MHHLSTSDDRSLALEVETALKALGIAGSNDGSNEISLRSAVEDLRSPRTSELPARRGTSPAPALQPDDGIFGLG